MKCEMCNHALDVSLADIEKCEKYAKSRYGKLLCESCAGKIKRCDAIILPREGEMRILNLTQRRATPEQIAAGVVEPDEENKKLIQSLLTFEKLPDREEIYKHARLLAILARKLGFHHAMIGGASYLMHHLEKTLAGRGIQSLYAFSKRETVEETLPDGSVQKTQVFRHTGFVIDVWWKDSCAKWWYDWNDEFAIPLEEWIEEAGKR